MSEELFPSIDPTKCLRKFTAKELSADYGLVQKGEMTVEDFNAKYKNAAAVAVTDRMPSGFMCVAAQECIIYPPDTEWHLVKIKKE